MRRHVCVVPCLAMPVCVRVQERLEQKSLRTVCLYIATRRTTVTHGCARWADIAASVCIPMWECNAFDFERNRLVSQDKLRIIRLGVYLLCAHEKKDRSHKLISNKRNLRIVRRAPISLRRTYNDRPMDGHERHTFNGLLISAACCTYTDKTPTGISMRLLNIYRNIHIETMLEMKGNTSILKRTKRLWTRV